MSDILYHRQVELLLKILPEISKETVFALHGGTAINLFVRNMPRLSVDIDLIYIPIESRVESLNNINIALNKIKVRIEKVLTGVQIQHKEKAGKLFITLRKAMIKVEVNLVARGILGEITNTLLCKKAEKQYDAFITFPIVAFGQLYGGKICAALDRQHPRDLFDIKYLLDNEGLSKEIIAGFLLALVSNDRPMHEILKPNLLDQKNIFEKHFIGMTNEVFTYNDFEETRNQLITLINKQLRKKDKEFLISVKSLSPDWTIYDFEKFPAVRWKLKNLSLLKTKNLKKYQYYQNSLKECLSN